MKKVFVTGAGGFIGRQMVRALLARGFWVRVLVRNKDHVLDWLLKTEIFTGDIRDEQKVKEAVSGCDTVFHLAARVHAVAEKSGNLPLYHQVNLIGTENLLKASADSGVGRFIFFSSVKAMGEGGGRCLDETADPKPETPYGKTKLAGENLVHEYGRRFGMHTVCLRFPLIYGPGVKGNLQRMMARIERGVFPPLPEFGNKRSLVHVRDVIRAALLAAEKDEARGKTYIVTDGRAYSTRELYVLMLRALGKPIPKWVVSKALLRGLARCGDIFRAVSGVSPGFDSEALEKLSSSAWYSSEKISRELGFRAEHTFGSSEPAEKFDGAAS